jgi:hypothetical protein
VSFRFDRSRRRSRVFEALEPRQMLTIKFVFNYSLDTNHFFDTQTKKSMLEFAGKMLSERLGDTLSAITPSGNNKWTATIYNPGTGNLKTLSNLSIPANTIVVYVGGRDMSALGFGGMAGFQASGTAAWRDLVRSRGEPGAVSTTNPTDIAPAVGHITFDTSGVKWHFGRTTSGLASDEYEFVSAAIHELTHVLGIVDSPVTPWRALTYSGKFHGTKTTAVYGQAVPVNSDLGHFAPWVSYDGIYAAMVPNLPLQNRNLDGPIDFAALDDIGWDISGNHGSIFRAAQTLTHTGPSGGPDSTTINASISSSKDVDFYRIYADAGTKISVDVTPSGFNSLVRLYSGAGTVLDSDNHGSVGALDSFDFNISRSDYYWVAVSSYKNRDYDPFSSSSGPGGNTGSYTLGISLEDAESLRSNLTKQGTGDLNLSANTSSTDVSLAAGSFTGATVVQAGTLNSTGLATPLATSATPLYVGGATAIGLTKTTSTTFTITGSSNPLLGTTGSDQSAAGTSTLDESLVDAVLEEPTSLT